MYAFNFKVFLGLFYAITVTLCAPHPTQNLDAGTVQTPATPGLDSLHCLRKRSKVGEIVGKVLTALDVGSEGVAKLIGDVLKLQKDFGSILKQLKSAGIIPGSQKDTKVQDPKQNTALTDAAPTPSLPTEVIVLDDRFVIQNNNTQETPLPAVLQT
ncbi:hypothetical protein PCANC_01223 [Puccinia coronata f. sp. avenae]|uniref:Uncharacterized protein n=1 Tax=Puccinia coronata f. sp. avenae TaxID=200324 RepID=A0A2N5THL2_9BASI|nr:hypothetical protein PCASD_23470 [Puccinia coronata f. sp. avenae]PLW44242.1 hypothetical protein PCASD_03863 [Puccinia coronata f. sp. avenae]PLW56835.1 hypothetical protein PCANC_01223 [Puccinia coronata f. sp. avenae]